MCGGGGVECVCLCGGGGGGVEGVCGGVVRDALYYIMVFVPWLIFSVPSVTIEKISLGTRLVSW